MAGLYDEAIGVLEKAVKIDDKELIGHLAERIARLLAEGEAPAGFARKASS